MGLVDIIERYPGGIIVHDGGRVLYASLAAARILGASDTGAIVGRDFDDFVPPSSQSAWEALLNADAPEPDAVDLRLVALGGRSVLTTLRQVSGVAFSGHNACVVCIQDVSTSRACEVETMTSAINEQEGFARELHDGLSQILAALAFKCEALRMDIPESMPAGAAQLDEIHTLINEAADQARDIERRLNPVEISFGGLPAALCSLAGRMSEAHSVACTFDGDGVADFPHDKFVSTQLYRIAERAANAAAREGGAERIIISLQSGPQGHCMQVQAQGATLQLRDADATRDLALAMANRARLIGATLDVDLDTSGGSVMRCVLPKDV